MQPLAQKLIAEELRLGGAPYSASRAAFRVCEKLRRPLSTYAGVAGFHSLLRRALGLAQTEVPWLVGLQIKVDGTIDFANSIADDLDSDAAVKGGAALVTQLLTLLSTFIGEALTLRLVHEVWPKAAVWDSKKGEK